MKAILFVLLSLHLLKPAQAQFNKQNYQEMVSKMSDGEKSARVLINTLGLIWFCAGSGVETVTSAVTTTIPILSAGSNWVTAVATIFDSREHTRDLFDYVEDLDQQEMTLNIWLGPLAAGATDIYFRSKEWLRTGQTGSTTYEEYWSYAINAYAPLRVVTYNSFHPESGCAASWTRLGVLFGVE